MLRRQSADLITNQKTQNKISDIFHKKILEK